MDENIKTCVFGGYDKISVLKCIDMLTSEICMLNQAVNNKKKGVDFVIPAETVNLRLKSGKLGGYDKTSTDRYIVELKDKIAGLRSQL